MPDVLRVRYLGNETVSIPLAGREVEPDCVFELPAKLTEWADGETPPDDAAVVDFGNPPQRVALPHSLYRVETPAKPRKLDAKVED